MPGAPGKHVDAESGARGRRVGSRWGGTRPQFTHRKFLRSMALWSAVTSGVGSAGRKFERAAEMGARG